MYKTAARLLQQRRERLAQSSDRDEPKPKVPKGIRRAFQKGEFVNGEIEHQVRGGFLIRVWDYEAFCPGFRDVSTNAT